MLAMVPISMHGAAEQKLEAHGAVIVASIDLERPLSYNNGAGPEYAIPCG